MLRRWERLVTATLRFPACRGGTIQITRATYELIKDEFVCEPRGSVDVKDQRESE